MKTYNRKGFAWIPVIIAILLGSPIVIGGSVAVSDQLTHREARKNEQPQDAKQILRDELNNFFNTYRQNCFSKVASVGNRNAYQKALEEIILAYNSKRTTDSFAEYSSGAIFTQRPVKEIDLTNEQARLEAQDTIWHELTHHLETQNGDRRSIRALNPNRTAWKERNERHTEYMKHALGILRQLMRVEKGVRDKTMTASQIKSTFSLLERQFASGSTNNFEKVPSDLDEFTSYTGFKVNLKEIFDLYKSGSCLKFPEGTFDATENSGSQAVNQSAETWVVWEATNATVGIAITTEQTYLTEEPTSNYPGGGLNSTTMIDKKLLSGTQKFASFEEAEKWICGQFTEVWYAPLGIGWTAKYGGRDVFLANTSCGK